MLNAIDHSKIKDAVESVVDSLGVPATWMQTKAPNDSMDVVVGFKSSGWKDEELVNAYGVGAKVFTVKVSDIVMIEKFDKFIIANEKYTINSVMPVYLNGIKVFHKCIVKGK